LSLRLQIELVYDLDCPNVERARSILTDACRAADVPAVWTEWNSEDAECPAYARNLGSPTILVNEEDVAPGPHPWAKRELGAGPRCRVYRDGDAIVPAPPVSRVEEAIGAALQPEVG
jgi:mercuric ion transport protein